MDDQIKDLYLRVLVLANTFLVNRKLIVINIELLKSVDPSAEEVSKIMKGVAQIVEGVAGSDPSLVLNVKQCALVMGSIADAIVEGDAEALENWFHILEQLAKSPPLN